jgi:hypothetical protein
MKKLLLLFALFCAVDAHAVIAFRSASSCAALAGQTPTVCQGTSSMSLVAGDTLVVFITNPNAKNATSMSVAAGCTLNFLAWPNTDLNIWTANITTTATCTLTAHTTTADSRLAFLALDYSGVTGIGKILTGLAGLTGTLNGTAQLSITTQDPNNFVLGVLSVNNGTTVVTAGPGTQPTGGRVTGNITQINVSQNTAATATAVSVGFTWPAGTGYITMNAIELRSAGSAVNQRVALFTDRMQTIVLEDFDYLLPTTKLDPTNNQWCVWPMNGAVPDVHVVSQPPSQLNGQTGFEITLTQWEMIRLCQDANGNYWANLPSAVTGASFHRAQIHVHREQHPVHHEKH